MSFTTPRHHVPRVTVVGVEDEFVKMFDPQPIASLPGDAPLPEPIAPTNPVPEVIAAVLGVNPPAPLHTHQHDLINIVIIPKWNSPLPPTSPDITFFTIGDDVLGAFKGGVYPAATLRMPRGVIFHSVTQGKGPPPHTIHWHGIEPTPVNDGVGHCSMELGKATYQFQPNYIGTYFYHCHRNTMQHFEFGLFGMLIVEPPDAYFASIGSTNPDGSVNLNGIPVGACSDGKYRTAADLRQFPQFPGFVAGHPTFGVGNAKDDAVGNPHAFTVSYDVEALWVPDDRDSRWSDLGGDARQSFPEHGTIPGVNDDFLANKQFPVPPPAPPGTLTAPFFAFNQFEADYWYVTGVPVPALRGGVGIINPAGAPPTGGGLPGGLIPPGLNSGKSGTMVAVNAQVGQTILVRCLNAAYNTIRVTFPVDVVIIAWDGRALGVPPFGLYNHPVLVPAGTPIVTSTARRYDALIRATRPNSAPAKIEFLDTSGGGLECTAFVPFNIV